MIGGPGSANPTGGSRSNRCQGGRLLIGTPLRMPVESEIR